MRRKQEAKLLELDIKKSFWTVFWLLLKRMILNIICRSSIKNTPSTTYTNNRPYAQRQCYTRCSLYHKDSSSVMCFCLFKCVNFTVTYKQNVVDRKLSVDFSA